MTLENDHESNNDEPPASGGRRTASVWTTRISVAIAIIALGTSIFMAWLAMKADNRSKIAEERARITEEQAQEDRQKAQAQWVDYYFERNAEGGADRLIVENRSQGSIDDVYVKFNEKGTYLYFDRIAACKRERIEPVVVDAENVEGQQEKYDLETAGQASVEFSDGQGVSWKKDFIFGLRSIKKPAPSEGAIDVSVAFSQNKAMFVEEVRNCQ